MAEKLKTAPEESKLEVVDIEKLQANRDNNRLGVLKTYKLYIDGQFPRTESGRYYAAKNTHGETVANVCLASRKDFRNSVVAARKAFSSWSEKTAYNRGQILYRIAEILEGRSSQFVDELTGMGSPKKDAEREVATAVDRLVYYAGWSDKYQQLFSAVNPVSSQHFNFSVPEPVGVVSMIAPEETALLGLVSTIAPVLVGGNTCITLASTSKPLCAITFAEVLATSDVPAGAVNILTGQASELASHFASHMDVNSIMYCGKEQQTAQQIETLAAENIKRVVLPQISDWYSSEAQDPYLIMEFQETKTTWHPVGV
jgi:acyl-CoA reductase-like NAD-dependent aldehyde dehydrogenase